ncbi:MULTISPECIES: copper amine oxidase N-terminal domain-containing protein [Paenibacillus]|uniref:copper amine oxidase N-terminal domain-containing protein n=1 Tax=Paenibacillus TaxID=44249 RepID=UPI0022B932F8|nr:copper amine oxidase N-terminal domain-containing protein [Paenibacillus caseinilyticus]MCZ8522484.1 copper amine oxidase N-terminal domain-containing protein [Paenibacillus caseinilyticus]
MSNKEGQIYEALEVPAQLIDSSTYIPVRFVSEAFGASVKWVPESRLILIQSDGTKSEPSEKEVNQWRLEAQRHWDAKH